MSSLEISAAENQQKALDTLQKSPWHTGYSLNKGAVTTEPLDSSSVRTDSIKRYTDKYIQERQIGRSQAEYQFIPEFLPNELLPSVGLEKQKREPVATAKEFKPETLEVKDDEDQRDKNTEKYEDQDAEEGEIEAEDEFEELEDDDYNAEKYFDDGDDYGIDEDGDNEAAY